MVKAGRVFAGIFRVVVPVLAVSWVGVASGAGFGSEMMGATFKLFHVDSTSACFLVQRPAPDEARYLVTTAHTLEGTKGETALLVLREAKPDGSYVRRDHPVQVRRGETPLWIRHKKHDVAVLRLEEPMPVPAEAVPLSWLASADGLAASGVDLCSPLFVLTYPERFEANGAGFPVARRGIFSSPPQLPVPTHPTFLADFTTFPGDSGGPVFIEGGDGHPLVVGIVLARNNHDVRFNSPYEDRVIRYPLGLGTILHAKYVIDTVEQAAKGK